MRLYDYRADLSEEGLRKVRKVELEKKIKRKREELLEYMEMLEELYREESVYGETEKDESAKQPEVFHEDGESDPSSKSCDG